MDKSNNQPKSKICSCINKEECTCTDLLSEDILLKKGNKYFREYFKKLKEKYNF